MEKTPVTMVPVEWILKHLASSVDTGDLKTVGDWQYMIEEKFFDCSQDFMDSVMSDGIQNPICLQYLFKTESDEWDWFAQGNGHHRLTMAIMLAMDAVPVVFSFTGEYMHLEDTSPGEW